MEECKPMLNTGLRGITIASTRISDVRGEEGKLIYRGFLVQDLAESATFEEVSYLLLFEKLPSDDELNAFNEQLVAARDIPPELIAALKTRPADSLPMDILQAATAMLANHDPDIRVSSRETSVKMAIRLIAKLATVLAAWDRVRNGKEPVAPDPGLSHAANFLYMMTGETPNDEQARFMDVCLVLHAEHSFNASTFAAREVASTRAHMYAAITAAIGSLSGELHGGANVRVMEMLLGIGTPDAVDDYVNKILDEGQKIMGLGHAVYKTDDPRAHILAPMSKKMGERTGQPQWYEMSKRLEKAGKAAFKERKGTDIYVNVDFYSASLYYVMGIPVDFFSPVFAISRVSGWTAHVLEEQFADAAPKPMLYRPESEYVGDYCGPDECTFVPLDNR
ncbi:Citrate synthase (si) (EC [Olavius algarvensis associated proteobacterium Delta 3]|nr:Citrate synthase (si) (EC [Olavius algarvensis associated proteobacterium Delta 3]CAB5148661.1 Citrate synthase (si) (EC [Olavius algarvensis associated proteobacterium Delta 3]